MKKNKSVFPRSALKHFVDDIVKLSGKNEGRMFILEMIEDIPYDLRAEVIQGISTFYEPELVDFFYLLIREYGSEFESICKRALDKYKMAGINTEPPSYFSGTFYGAYASISRHTGRMAVDVAWETANGKVQVECFYLTFNSDGLHSFFLIEDMSRERYETDRKYLEDMEPLSYEEVCYLVLRAYRFNVTNMSRPAAGKFLYDKYLSGSVKLDEKNYYRLIRKLSIKLTPRQVVNSFFHALKYNDTDYAAAMLLPDKYEGNKLLEETVLMPPGAVIIEGGVENLKGVFDRISVKAYSIVIRERQLYRNQYHMHLGRNDVNQWCITSIKRGTSELIEMDAESNPFNETMFCRVYEILDLDVILDIVDKLNNIREVKEIPYGLHLRITKHKEDFNAPVLFLSGVVADLVINGEEFVTMSREVKVLDALERMLTEGVNSPVLEQGEYEISVLTSFRYLSGQFVHFEDILMQEEHDNYSEDGMRFLSTRYLVKDWKRVYSHIEKLSNIMFHGQDEYDVFYQFDSKSTEGGMLVEYILGSNWATLSAFSERDMNRAKRSFEEEMFEYLEFDGMEVRDEGVFDVLTSDIKKSCPDLENFLKEVYLNKWFNTRLINLKGMSPCEASQTEEGRRLLWAMFKKIKQKDKKRRIYGKLGHIRLREYLDKLEQKKGENIKRHY